MKDYYKILGLEFAKRSRISANEIKRSYQKLILALHPDKNNNQNSPLVPEINEAYHALYDSAEARSQYDQSYKEWLANRNLIIGGGIILMKLAISLLDRAHQHLVDEAIKKKRTLPNNPQTQEIIKTFNTLLKNLRSLIEPLIKSLLQLADILDNLPSPTEEAIPAPESSKSESSNCAAYPLLEENINSSLLNSLNSKSSLLIAGSSLPTQDLRLPLRTEDSSNFLVITGRIERPDTNYQQSQFFESPRKNSPKETKLIHEAIEILSRTSEKLNLYGDQIPTVIINVMDKSSRDLHLLATEFDQAFLKVKKLKEQNSNKTSLDNVFSAEIIPTLGSNP